MEIAADKIRTDSKFSQSENANDKISLLRKHRLPIRPIRNANDKFSLVMNKRTGLHGKPLI